MPDANHCTTVYNDNQACVDWSSSMTNKGTKHITLCKNKVRESHQDNSAHVAHIPGIINASDLFTKEIKCAIHYCRLCDSMMVSKANFIRFHHTVPDYMTDHFALPYYSIRSSNPPSVTHTIPNPAAS